VVVVSCSPRKGVRTVARPVDALCAAEFGDARMMLLPFWRCMWIMGLFMGWSDKLALAHHKVRQMPMRRRTDRGRALYAAVDVGGHGRR